MRRESSTRVVLLKITTFTSPSSLQSTANANDAVTSTVVSKAMTVFRDISNLDTDEKVSIIDTKNILKNGKRPRKTKSYGTMTTTSLQPTLSRSIKATLTADLTYSNAIFTEIQVRINARPFYPTLIPTVTFSPEQRAIAHTDSPKSHATHTHTAYGSDTDTAQH